MRKIVPLCKGAWNPGMLYFQWNPFLRKILFEEFLFILHKQLTLTGPHCAQPFIAVAKRKHIWNVIGTALKGFVLVLKGSPCTCVFTALSLAKVRPPLLDKCRAFSALSTSCCPVPFHWLPSPPPPSSWAVVGKHLGVDDTTPVQLFDQGTGCSVGGALGFFEL